MTANCGAEKCIEIHETIGNEFLSLDDKELAGRFKELGYRFPNIRANYIFENRNFLESINNNIKNGNEDNDLRDWLVKSIKGLGYKEASHFLRNIGYTDYAIIDFHIVDLLAKYSLVEKPKTMTKKKYLEIEGVLSEIASILNTNLAALDLYLWYLETGKILK
jgi:N-glycosylase/DNA lyase